MPTLRTVRSTVPASVEAAITKALAKVPADRFTSAAQFVEALSTPVPAAPSTGAKKLPAARIAGIGIALTAAVGGLLFARSRRPHVEPSASVIAVLPFGTSGDSALTRLSHDLVLTVSATLDGVGGIRAADPHQVLSKSDDSRSGQWVPNALALGKSLGAGSILVGDIVKVGAGVQLNLKLLSTKGDSEPLARLSVSNSPDSISALTDSITWALLRQVWRRGEPPSPSYANITTHSVPALRAFLDGERLSQAARFAEAIEAYAAAIKADSTFWLAGWRYNFAQGWVDGDQDPDLERGYRSHLAAFGERDRLLIQAEMSADSTSYVDHVARLHAIAERFPDDWSAAWQYADHLWRGGPLIGHTRTETRAALQRIVDQNPRLAYGWEHLARASFGHDSAQAAQAVKSLMALGGFKEPSEHLGLDVSLYYRLLVSAGGQLSLAILDSLAVGIAQSKVPFVHKLGADFLQSNGFPSAQVEMNRRLLALDPHGPYAGVTWRGTAIAWAARGAWDSALVAWDRFAAAGPEHASALEGYQLAVAGAWLGGLDTALAAGRRAAAAKYVGELPVEDSAAGREARATLGWTDGMLSVLRRDLRGLAVARMTIRRSGAEGAGFLDRSLAAFESELRGTERPAADSLAVLDLAATETELFAGRDAYARSIDHLAASRLLLEAGDTSRAVRLLTWHEAKLDPEFQVFAPLAYYELARIEEAQNRKEQARDHYQQFLRRYDMPPPAHQHLVDEAKAALRRLSGQNDAP